MLSVGETNVGLALLGIFFANRAFAPIPGTSLPVEGACGTATVAACGGLRRGCTDALDVLAVVADISAQG